MREDILVTLSFQIPLLYLVFKCVHENMLLTLIILTLIDLLVFLNKFSGKQILIAALTITLLATIVKNFVYTFLIIILSLILSALIFFGSIYSLLSILSYFIILGYKLFSIELFVIKNYLVYNIADFYEFDELLVVSLGILISTICSISYKRTKASFIVILLSAIVTAVIYLASLINVYTSPITMLGFSTALLVVVLAKTE